MFKMCGRFPGSVMLWVTNPLDEVFLAVVMFAMVKDFVNFEFF